MKIAVLFSGRIHRYQEHYDNIQAMVVQGHSCDFFLSHSPECVENLEEFVARYQPRVVCDDPIQYLDVSRWSCHPQSNPHNMMCMWVNRQRVFEGLRDYMVRTRTWYDLVISTRLDTWCYEPLNYGLVTEVGMGMGMGDDTVWVPGGSDWGGLNDQLAMGSYYAMEKYMMLYPEVEPLLDELMTSIGYYGPEPLLKAHIDRVGLRVERFPLNYRLINGKIYHHP